MRTESRGRRLIGAEIEKAVKWAESNRKTAPMGGLSEIIGSLVAIREETHSVSLVSR